MSVDRGVPQGSILGPLLYLLYINEIAAVINEPHCNNSVHSDNTQLFSENCSECGQVIVYADDCTYLVSDKNRVENQRKLNLNLAKLEIFMNSNDLVLNTSKSAVLELMIKQKKGRTLGDPPPHLIVVNPQKPGEHLKISDSKKFRILGANFQPNLSWQAHLETGSKAILPAIRKLLGSLQQMSRKLPTGSKKTIAEGLIMSKFQYLISQWGGGATNNYIVQAQRLQNKVARWITRDSKKVKIRTLLENCKWMSINEMTIYHSTIQLWKLFNTGKPEFMAKIIKLEDDNSIKINPPRLQFTQKGWRWRSIETWNQLPGDIKEIKTLQLMKRKVKAWIIDRRNVTAPVPPVLPDVPPDVPPDDTQVPTPHSAAPTQGSDAPPRAAPALGSAAPVQPPPPLLPPPPPPTPPPPPPPPPRNQVAPDHYHLDATRPTVPTDDPPDDTPVPAPAPDDTPVPAPAPHSAAPTQGSDAPPRAAPALGSAAPVQPIPPLLQPPPPPPPPPPRNQVSPDDTPDYYHLDATGPPVPPDDPPDNNHLDAAELV